jgi:cyclophilin family peptidyl-prolyl cis-trans isomerase
MIQGGDPRGDGMGGPGFTIPDEIVDGGVFDRPGLLAMANSGPNTNGSQFFVTSAPAHQIDGKHTIFGSCDTEVVEQVMAEPLERGRAIPCASTGFASFVADFGLRRCAVEVGPVRCARSTGGGPPGPMLVRESS